MAKRVGLWVWTAGWFAAAVASGWLYYGLYWRWRGCFDARGACFDGAVVHHSENFVLVLPLVIAAICGGAGLIALSRLRRPQAEENP